MKVVFLFALLNFISSCTELPVGVEVVNQFELDRYLGKWYEIARLDHKFERGLVGITVEYRLNDDDDGIQVINQGYDQKTGKLNQAIGIAYFTESKDLGSLKVSFFPPFYSGYHIIELDKKDYQYALVSGSSRHYLWVLSRKPSLEKSILKRLMDSARSLGFPVEQLIFTEQPNNPKYIKS